MRADTRTISIQAAPQRSSIFWQLPKTFRAGQSDSRRLFDAK